MSPGRFVIFVVLRVECRDQDIDFFPRQTTAETFPAEFGMIGQDHPDRRFFQHQGNLFGTFVADIQQPVFIYAERRGKTDVRLVIIQ